MRKAKSQNSSPLNQDKILNFKPLNSLYLTKVTSLNHHSMVLIYNSRIKSFADVEIKNDCSFIDLSLNQLTDFTDFPSSLSDLTALILDSNQIVSFNGMQSGSFPKLRFLSLKQNPISQNIYFKLMCLVVFGSQLCSINGEKVSDLQRQNAIKLRKLLFPYLIQGKIITNLDPLRFREASSENEKCKTTPYMKKIQIKSRATYSSPIYNIKDTTKKTDLKRSIIEMINDNNIVASPTNYLRRKKYILDNEIEEQKTSPVKNSQRNTEEGKNTSNQANLKNNKKKFVEKNNQINKERQKLAKKETDTNYSNKEEQKTAKFTNSHAEEQNDRKKILVENNHHDDDKEKMTNDEENDAFKQKEVDEKCHLESAIDQAEKKNEQNEQSSNEEQKVEIDANKIVNKEVNVTMKTIDDQIEGKDDQENMQINKNEQKLLEDKKKDDEQVINDENKQEEEIKDENDQMEEELNDENKQEEELNDVNDQMEEELNDENKQEEELNDVNDQVEEELNDENNQVEEEELNDVNDQVEEEELNDENNQVEEEEENDEYNQMEDDENDENNQVEEEELNDENYQMEEEEENDEYSQVELEEHQLNQSIIQVADKTGHETHSAKKVRFALDEINQPLDQDDSRKLEIDKNLTVENEQEKEQDDSKFDIDHYYTYRAHNDFFIYTFGNIDDPSTV